MTTRFLELAEIAAEDPNGRLAVRTPTGIASFFPTGDALEARVTQAQADYFAGIEGFDVEGRDPKPAAEAPVEDWIKEGERLRKQRDQVEAAPAPQADPLAAIVALLGGPAAVQAILAQALTARAPQVAEVAEQQIEQQRQAAERVQAERAAAQGWTFFKLQGKVTGEQATLLLAEFDPAYVTDGQHVNALLSRVAKIAADNHVLSDRLTALVG